jgi:hypothetical protein
MSLDLFIITVFCLIDEMLKELHGTQRLRQRGPKPSLADSEVLTITRQTFYGFRVHVRLCWPGVITRFELAPADVHETAAALDLAQDTIGVLVGDRNYWSPYLKEELLRGSVELQAPFRKASHDPWPHVSALLSRVRYRIDTVFGQLVERYQVKRVWARDSWHLNSRMLRKVLSHTVAFFLNQLQGNPPLQLAKLLI